MKGEIAKSKFVAAEVARDVRYDVHAGTPALETMGVFLTFAATRDGRGRPRSVALYDIVAVFVDVTIDEVVAVLPPDGLLERDECFLLLKALTALERFRSGGSSMTRECSRDSDGARDDGWDIPSSRSWAMCGCHGDDFVAEGCGGLLTRLDVIMSSEFEAKLLGRVRGEGTFQRSSS